MQASIIPGKPLPMRPPLVIYQNYCLDGYASAWCFYNHNPTFYEFLPGTYQDGTFDRQMESGIFDDRSIFLIDFSYPLQLMERLLEAGARITLLDHHKSALENIPKLTYHPNFNADHSVSFMSGCGICWDYFHKGKPPPLLLQHIQDRDLWQFKLAHTRAVCEALYNLPGLGVELIDKMIKEERVDELIDRGEVLLVAKTKRIGIAMARAVEYTDAQGDKFWSVNSTVDPSEIGNELCSKPLEDGSMPKYSVVWYASKEGVKYSLRSIGDFDVTVKAREYGGGGHRNAAGYTIRSNVE